MTNADAIKQMYSKMQEEKERLADERVSMLTSRAGKDASFLVQHLGGAGG